MENGALTNLASGVLRILEGTAGSRSLNLELDNRGTVEVEREVTLLQANARHQNTGLIHLKSGVFIHYRSGNSASFANAGEIRVLAGATVRTLFGQFQNVAGGTLSLHGADLHLAHRQFYGHRFRRTGMDRVPPLAAERSFEVTVTGPLEILSFIRDGEQLRLACSV